MFAITSVTGKVGGSTARRLLSTGRPIRAIVRNEDSAAAWAEAGADTAIADFNDSAGLAEALRGAEGAFVMLPTDPAGTDTSHRATADSIASAVQASRIPQVVMLSSVGADLAEGTGPIRWLHHLESKLRETDAVLTALRAPHFQEEVALSLDAALGDGVFPVFGKEAVNTPMAATADIGAAAAHFLTEPADAERVVDLDAPAYTAVEIADMLSDALGRDVVAAPIPRSAWQSSLVDAGMPDAIAAELAQMYGADQDGLLQPRSPLSHPCRTELRTTVDHIINAVNA